MGLQCAARNPSRRDRVDEVVPEWMLDLLLPPTDNGARAQWVAAAMLWLVVLVATRRWSKDARLLLWGLATVNLAWFLLRMAH